jgi:hypothetical protein
MKLALLLIAALLASVGAQNSRSQLYYLVDQSSTGRPQTLTELEKNSFKIPVEFIDW